MIIRTNLRIWLIVLISTFGVCWSTAQAKIIYVDAHPILGGDDGTTWPTAFKYLQDALDAAEDGDQIWVAAGTYYPTAEVGATGDRYKTFQMINGVAIYGGFPDMGLPDFDDRNPDIYKTILSGDIGTSEDNSDNCFHIFYHPDNLSLDPNAVLDGFTITGGNADGSEYHSRGGGMFNLDSSPTVTGCWFSDNLARFGAGMSNINSNPTVTNCTFNDNTASIGCGGMSNDHSSPMVYNCMFSGNSAFYDGGGLDNWASNPTIINCTFKINKANADGGGVSNAVSDPTIINCLFIGNSANKGGGMSNYLSFPKVTNCIMWGDSANRSDEIYSYKNSIPMISYSDIQDCGGSGGGWDDDLGTDGGGNIDVNPKFADPGYWNPNNTPKDPNDDYWVDGDYHLLPTSPCIDAGDPDYVTSPSDVDKDGKPRVVDGKGDGIARIDMGPYEFQKYCGGTGTAEDPYLICAPVHMQQIGANPDDWDKYFKLMDDIDLSAYTDAQFNIIGWYVDGIENEPFTGVFNGNGHTISNFTYTSAGASYVGLFGYVTGQTAVIRDLVLIDPNINSTAGTTIGALAGYIVEGTISNCHTRGGTVTGDKTVGALAGQTGKVTILQCSAACDVTGNGWGIGGLIGDAWQTTISACYATGSVTANTWGVGGLVGHQYGGQIHTSYATGAVTATDIGVGGLIGNGEWMSIVHCYAAGSVRGVDEVGGLVGRYYHGDILASFWDTLASGQADGIGYNEQIGTVEIYGRTTPQMRQQATFNDYGWDFAGKIANGSEDVWTIWEGAYYPRLTWENPLAGDFTIDGKWMYQNLPGATSSSLTASVFVTENPLGNSSYTYDWGFVLPDDVTMAPTTTDDGGSADTFRIFAAPNCNEPGGLSDSGRPLTITVTVTGDDHGNTGKAQAEFGIALLGDVNNDGVVNVADRSIINAFWRLGAAGPFTFRDCNVNCDSAVNVADRSIANAVWRGVLGCNSVSEPCPFRPLTNRGPAWTK